MFARSSLRASQAFRSSAFQQVRRVATTQAGQAQGARSDLFAAGAFALTAGIAAFGLSRNVEASSDQLHPLHLPWEHEHPFTTFDHAAIRRGFQVYREVCSTCHSLRFLAFRHFVDVSHTEEEMKAIAAEYEVEDGPNDQGEMFTRPAKLFDYLPKPYPNDKAARAGNNGALPPDLSLIVKARHDGLNYIFSLLTGYRDPPAGIDIREGLHYNPYFPGSAIGMARVLYDGLVEYEDGTPATASQMAKDVSIFLNWAAEPEHDERKKTGVRMVVLIGLSLAGFWFLKRRTWSYIKNRKIVYTPPEVK